MATKGGSNDQMAESLPHLDVQRVAANDQANAEAAILSRLGEAGTSAAEDSTGSETQAMAGRIDYFFASADPAENTPGGLAPESLLQTPGAGALLIAYNRIASSRLRDAVLQMVQRLAQRERGGASLTLAKTPPRGRRSNSQAR